MKEYTLYAIIKGLKLKDKKELFMKLAPSKNKLIINV